MRRKGPEDRRYGLRVNLFGDEVRNNQKRENIDGGHEQRQKSAERRYFRGEPSFHRNGQRRQGEIVAAIRKKRIPLKGHEQTHRDHRIRNKDVAVAYPKPDSLEIGKRWSNEKREAGRMVRLHKKGEHEPRHAQ